MSNKEKKAMSFDFMSMFEQTRKTAMENSRDALAQREVEEDETRKQMEKDLNITIPDQKKTLDTEVKASSSGRNTEGIDDSTKHSDADSDEDDIGPALPPGFKASTSIDEDQQKPSTSKAGGGDVKDSGVEEDDSDDDDDDFYTEVSVEQLIPAASEVVLKHGTKPISALGVDQQGARLMTGCYNYDVKIWDFGGMDSGFRPFREIRPVESHILKSLAFSLNGEKILVASGNAQAKVIQRDGKEWAECIKGDKYLHDSKRTKGHTMGLNGGLWHPWAKDEFMTYSDDGTIRLWSLDDFKQVTSLINTQRTVMKAKTSAGQKTHVTAGTYSKDGKLVAGGCLDGSIQMWKHGGLYVNHALINRNAHVKGNEITSISFSYDGNGLLSRSMDDTMKLWDIRKFKEPVFVASDLENFFGVTECCWSSRDELCITGTSCRKGRNGAGKLVFFDRTSFKPVYQIEYPDESVLRCNWHPKINQVFVGLSSGLVKLYYDQNRSARGALLCVHKPARRERKAEILKNEIILAPLGEKLFQANPHREDDEEKEVSGWRIKKYLRMKQRDPNRKYPKAEEPFTGPGAQGKLTASGSTLHSYFAQQLGVLRNKELINTHDDVRESILRHAEEAEKDPKYIGRIYEKSEPVKIFQKPEDEAKEEDDELQPHFKKPKIV